MKIEEAMVYLLATSQHGMKTEQIARELVRSDDALCGAPAVPGIMPPGKIVEGEGITGKNMCFR